MKATVDNLNEIMSFDHVIRVHEDGSVTDEPNAWAPELLDDKLQSDKWEFFTHGYSGQDRYSGPIMHDSEYIGGGLARDVLASPGVYVALINYLEGNDEDHRFCDAEGWAIVRLKGS